MSQSETHEAHTIGVRDRGEGAGRGQTGRTGGSFPGQTSALTWSPDSPGPSTESHFGRMGHRVKGGKTHWPCAMALFLRAQNCVSLGPTDLLCVEDSMRERLGGRSHLERAHLKEPREAIPESMSDALGHSSGWINVGQGASCGVKDSDCTISLQKALVPQQVIHVQTGV